jgi:hypothetical protein
MEQDRFKIVFEKLAEGRERGAVSEAEVAETEQLRAESEEIAELRRLVLEITEPTPKSYTTT